MFYILLLVFIVDLCNVIKMLILILKNAININTDIKECHIHKEKSNAVITSSKGPNQLCHYKRVTKRRVVQVNKKYFKTKHRPVSILLNVSAMICFKFKLRSNKNNSSIIVNF